MHLITIGHRGDPKAMLQQEFFQKLLDFLIVIDNQNMRFTSRSQSPHLPMVDRPDQDLGRSLVDNANGLNHFTNCR